MEKKGTSASPATALASRVLPVPGGPTNKAPLGIFPPSSVNFLGFFRNSTISCTSCLAPACPATSAKVTRPTWSFSTSRARLLPTLKIPIGPPPEPPPPMRRITNIHMNRRKIRGPKLHRKLPKRLLFFLYVTSPLKLPNSCWSARNSSSLSLEGYSVST